MPLPQIHHPRIDLAHPLPPHARLPQSLLYATASDIGGVGLASSSLEGILASYRHGFLGEAIGYSNQQREVAPSLIYPLAAHPVRLLSALPSEEYYGAKKRYLDWIASRELKTGKFDCFHGWSGDAERSLIIARERGIPSMIEIPTWHRDKFVTKPFETQSETEARLAKGLAGVRRRLPVDRARILLEYELTDLVLVQSQLAAESFIHAGIPPEKVFYVARGVDPDKYPVTQPPSHFRLTFVGALKKRKGIHHLLKAWHDLALKDAELTLVGNLHDEIKPCVEQYQTDSVTIAGFVSDVPAILARSSAFVFPSELEGSAKATFEAASCALPLITTREAGDAVKEGENGLLVPANDPQALADAIRRLYDDPDLRARMGQASRRRVLDHFTWDHYRARLLHAYAHLMTLR